MLYTKTLLQLLLVLLSTGVFFPAASQNVFPVNRVAVTGAMRNVMWKGQLQGTIDLDTLSGKKHLYGLGPTEFLRGEILIVDGDVYRSVVVDSSTMKVEKVSRVKAPFFVSAYVPQWIESNLPDSVQTLRQLEAFLNAITQQAERPFSFRLTGQVDEATIHIVNLPEGAKVSSPDDAHEGQVTYQLQNEKAEIVGFFSTQHMGVFTHHDTCLHLHLITADKTKMGHLDHVQFKKGTIKLYLPTQ